MSVFRLIRLLPLVLPILCLGGRLEADAAAERDDAGAAAESRGPLLKREIKVPVPPDLRGLVIEQPQAEYLVRVSEAGNVTEALCLHATHVGLVDAGMDRVTQAAFEPALQLGVPVSTTCTITVRFFDPEQEAWKAGMPGMPFGNDVSEGMQRRLYRAAKDSYVYRKSRTDELDDLLVVAEGGLVVVEDPEGYKPKGECVVEFYIGPDGAVRFPRVAESDGELVSMSALLSLRKIRFQPPTREGRKTYVQVRQPFRFRD